MSTPRPYRPGEVFNTTMRFLLGQDARRSLGEEQAMREEWLSARDQAEEDLERDMLAGIGNCVQGAALGPVTITNAAMDFGSGADLYLTFVRVVTLTAGATTFEWYGDDGSGSTYHHTATGANATVMNDTTILVHAASSVVGGDLRTVSTTGLGLSVSGLDGAKAIDVIDYPIISL